MGTVQKLFENNIIRDSILDEFEVGDKLTKNVAIQKVLDILEDNGVKEDKNKAYELLKMIRNIKEYRLPPKTDNILIIYNVTYIEILN